MITKTNITMIMKQSSTLQTPTTMMNRMMIMMMMMMLFMKVLPKILMTPPKSIMILYH